MRWGIAGYGDVVLRRALPALRSLGEPVTCVWGRSAARAAAVAQSYGIPVGTGSYAELLDRADAVYVATPVAAHVPLALDAARAGRHVLIEKPLRGALDGPGGLGGAGGPDGRGGLDLATAELSAAPVTVGVAYYRRLAPALVRLRALVPTLPPVRRVTVRFRCPFDPSPSSPMWWRTQRDVSGGGVLADAGSHRIDLLCWLFGPPLTVRARLADRFPGGAERRAWLDLGWPSGVCADLAAEWHPRAVADSLVVHCVGGRAVVLDPLDGETLREAGGGIRAGGTRAGGTWAGGTHAGGTRDGGTWRAPPAGNLHASLFADFAAAVRDRRPPVCPLPDAVLVDRILAAAELSSAASGRAVSLNSKLSQ